MAFAVAQQNVLSVRGSFLIAGRILHRLHSIAHNAHSNDIRIQSPIDLDQDD